MSDPDQLIQITLPARQWDLVLEVLGNVPWRIANPVILEIMRQSQIVPPNANGGMPSFDRPAV